MVCGRRSASSVSTYATVDAPAMLPTFPATAAPGDKPARATARRWWSDGRAGAISGRVVRQSIPACWRRWWFLPSRIRRQCAEPLWIEQAKQTGEQRQRPHRRILCRRKRVEQNRVRSREQAHGQPGKRAGEQGREIAEVKFPGHVALRVAEIHQVFPDDLL